MTDKKKPARSSRGSSRAHMVKASATNGAKESASEPKAVSSAKETVKEEKTANGAREPVKEVRAVSRDRERERSKAAASKAAAAKPSPSWSVRLRKYRLISFILDAWYELRHKVTWPTPIEARNMTIIVILLSAAIGLVLGLVDLGLWQVFLLISHIGAPK